MAKLALLGGEKAVDKNQWEYFRWPLISEEDEQAALEVVRNNRYSLWDITDKFQEEFASWLGVKHAVCYCNGTAAIAAAFFAIGLKLGDEVICTTKTYWASVAQACVFGATPVFCNVDDTLNMIPEDIERCISEKTKAIVVVHYMGYPCDMDKIMAIAKKHNLYVIEDVSHAQGGLYKGKRLGTFGDIAGMSLMGGKSFAAGELGITVTNNTKLYERALAYGHYDRNNANFVTESEDFTDFFNMPLGAMKGRANQLCTALARYQLKYYDERCAVVRKAMNYFYDKLEGIPGIRTRRVDEATGSNMAGFYCPHCIYKPEELGGLSVKRFCEALRAEGVGSWDGANYCLHTHKYFRDYVFPANGLTGNEVSGRNLKELDKLCKPSEEIQCFSIPLFKHFVPEEIDKCVNAIKKVVENHQQLLELDKKDNQGGRWFGTENE